MSKPLAGPRVFEAMGRSACSLELGLNYQRSMRVNWPKWSRQAWDAGYLMQSNKNIKGTT